MNPSDNTLESITQERDNLRSSLSEKQQEIEQLRVSLAELEGSTNDLKSRLSLLLAENDRLNLTITSQAQELQTLKAQSTLPSKPVEKSTITSDNQVPQTTSTKRKIGVLIGSSRHNGNWRGIHSWLTSRLAQHFRVSTTSFELSHDLVDIYPAGPMHPLGPVTEPVITALIKSGEYIDERTKQWSQLVGSCDGFVILTPQYNWGYPGDLKNALDHLYHEWHDKPVLLVTYGGRGGGKCSAQLREVFQGLHMKAVSDEVAIKLPEEYIRGTTRMAQGDFDKESLLHEQHKFLCEYEEVVDKAAKQFFALLQQKE